MLDENAHTVSTKTFITISALESSSGWRNFGRSQRNQNSLSTALLKLSFVLPATHFNWWLLVWFFATQTRNCEYEAIIRDFVQNRLHKILIFDYR